MISNRYGFIFIHTPKTGGTSVLTALHEDTDRECHIHMEQEVSGGIAAVLPGKKDFPWWGAWIQQQRQIEEYFKRNGIAQLFLDPATAVFSHSTTTSNVGGGNIKHLPIKYWAMLLADQRLQSYGSFLENYGIVTTCRNPYNREFSKFIYTQRPDILTMISYCKQRGFSNEQVSKKLQSNWRQWASINLRSTPDSNKTNLLNTQCDFYSSIDNSPNLQYFGTDKPFFIRLEHMEEDYNKFCKMVGIKRKTTKMPHNLNTSGEFKEYLPDNILEWYVGEPFNLIHESRKEDFELLPYEKEV